MGTINRFEDLEIWKLSRQLCHEIYEIIESTNLKNNFKLCNQIDGSSGSVMDNIAEGFERNGNKEFIQFLLLRKLPVEKPDHNCIGFLTEILFRRKNLKH